MVNTTSLEVRAGWKKVPREPTFDEGVEQLRMMIGYYLPLESSEIQMAFDMIDTVMDFARRSQAPATITLEQLRVVREHMLEAELATVGWFRDSNYHAHVNDAWTIINRTFMSSIQLAPR
jgi:hypothetical protein